MAYDKMILLILHITFGAVAFATALGAPSAVKRARAVGADTARVASKELLRRVDIANIAWVLTFLSGLALVFVVGGFKVVAPPIHAAMGIVLVTIAVGYVVVRPQSKALVAAATSGDEGRMDRALRNVNMGSGLMQAVWLVTLGLMLHH